MNGIVKYALIAAVIGGYFYYDRYSSNDVVDDIDLSAVLDVTVDTIHAYQKTLDGKEGLDADQTFIELGNRLETDYNAALPPLHKTKISVAPRTDASLLAYEDTNNNKSIDEGENALFLIEIDGEKSRVIATSGSGAVNEHHFSGTGLLAGYLIGSMLSRQRAAGVSASSLANKKPVTARAAARARAGSGSHSRGK